MCELITGLADSGVQVILVAPGDPRPGSYNPQPGVTMCPVASIPLSRDGEWRFAVVSRNKRKQIRQMLSELSLNHRVIIHSHTEFSLGWTARGLAAELKLPWVHSSHTYWPAYRHYLLPGLRRLPLEHAMQRFLRTCGVCVTPSLRGKNWLTGLIPETCRLQIVPNGIKTGARPSADQTEAVRNSWNIPAHAQLILYAGRLAPEKRVIELCRALAATLEARNLQYLEGKGQALYLAIVGGGPTSAALNRSIRELGVDEWVVATGWLAREELLPWYNAADVFCSMSRSEVHPITQIEAAAAGLPAVVLNDPAMRSIVIHNQTGILVQEDSRYAEAVSTLLDDHVSRRKMKLAAEIHSRNFSRESHVEALCAVYSSLPS
ncbi:hypothetical protein JCM12856_15310 [Spirochaeta dissipatitropha]